jgi:hypothetical protein
VLLGRAAAGPAGPVAAPAIVALALIPILIVVVLVASSAAMRRLSAPARDLAMLFRVHRGEAASAVLVRILSMGLCGACVPLRVLGVARPMMALGLAVVVRRRLVMEGGFSMVGRLTAPAADLGHVAPVPAHGLAAASAGLGGLLGIELVGGPLPVRRPASFTGDLALFFRVHRGEAASAAVCHGVFSSMRERRMAVPTGNDRRRPSRPRASTAPNSGARNRRGAD